MSRIRQGWGSKIYGSTYNIVVMHRAPLHAGTCATAVRANGVGSCGTSHSSAAKEQSGEEGKKLHRCCGRVWR